MKINDLIKEVERLKKRVLDNCEYYGYRDDVGKLKGIKQTVEAVDESKGFFMDSDYKQLHKDWKKLKKLLGINGNKYKDG